MIINQSLLDEIVIHKEGWSNRIHFSLAQAEQLVAELPALIAAHKIALSQADTKRIQLKGKP